MTLIEQIKTDFYPHYPLHLRHQRSHSNNIL